jgi:hypothetical protein
MKIAIIGAGNVGGTLGRRWADAAHQVRYGVRSPDSANPAQTTVADAAKFGDVVVLCTPWPAVADALTACGPLAGKVLIDCTNPLKADLSGLELGTTASGAEKVAQLASGALVVKCFNSVGFGVMADPYFNGRKATMFYCGDDGHAKHVAHTLAADLGFDPQDAGPLIQARLLEPYALLWISLAIQQGFGRNFAFQLMRR